MVNKTLSDKKVNEIYNFIRKNISKDAAEGFRKRDDKVQWIKDHWNDLEEFEAWTLKYSSVDDLTKPSTKVLEDIFNKNPDINAISEARMKTILDNNDISEKELRDYYKLRYAQQEQVDKFNKERYNELNELNEEYKRANDNSYYNTPIANEYARKAYIQGDIDKAKWHEVAGKIAGASDFAPFPISLAGPMIRQYQRYDAGVEKPSYIPSTETLLDYGSAVIPDIAERPAKLGLRYAKGALEKVLNKAGDTKLFKQLENIAAAKDAASSAKAAMRDKALIGDLADMNKYSTEELLKLANSTDNPNIKNEIYKFIDARNSGQPLPTSIDLQMKELPSIELKANSPEVPVFKNGSVDVRYQPVNASQLAEYQALQDRGGRIANILETGLNLGNRKFARSGIRGDVFPTTWYDYKPEFNEDKAINEVIKMYSDGWQVDKLPSNYDEPLIKAAYDKWLNDNKFNYIYNWRIK